MGATEYCHKRIVFREAELGTCATAEMETVIWCPLAGLASLPEEGHQPAASRRRSTAGPASEAAAAAAAAAAKSSAAATAAATAAVALRRQQFRARQAGRAFSASSPSF
jgi:hypothetical protein